MRVASDTSPLTNLAAIHRFELLRSLFGELHVAEAVRHELDAGGRRHPDSAELAAAPWIHVHAVGDRPLVEALRRDLDRGEAETLALSLALGARVVLMDEREGRRAASRLGSEPLGVLGVLLLGKRRRLLPEVRTPLDALREVAGFYLAEPLYRRVLDAAGE